MQFSSVRQIADNVTRILEQRIAVNAHSGEDPNRDQCDGHYHDAYCGCHWDQHQLRISDGQYQDQCLDRIPRF